MLTTFFDKLAHKCKYVYICVRKIKMETQIENKKSGTLCFYATGDSLTGIIRELIQEGSFIKAKAILEDGKMPPELIKRVFLYQIRFFGDTRTEEGLFTGAETEQPTEDELSEIYTTAIATAFACSKDFTPDEEGWRHIEKKYEWRHALKRPEKNEEFACLNTILTFEEIIDLAAIKTLAREGYVAAKINENEIEKNGVVLKSGEFITCGHQGHSFLYPILYELGLASSSDWTSDKFCLHVSEGQLSGSLANNIVHPQYAEGYLPTDKQLNTLFKFKKHIVGEYGGYKSLSTTEMLRHFVNETECHGGKYNNLAFLKRFYPQINLPVFSKEKIEGKYCIRTSPECSMPGLLDSKFEVTESSISEIKYEFEEAIKATGKVFENNTLHFFYQQYLDGGNGVCHYFSEQKFNYQYSEKRGSVVKGSTCNSEISIENKNELFTISKTLHDDLKTPIQLEFVVSGGKLYIVQLRLLKNNPSEYGVKYTPNGKVLVSGKTFSTPHEYASSDSYTGITIDDILIVDSEAESKQLIGKKALIVKSNVEFSHILALSKALSIPSMFDTGEIDLSLLNGKLDFVAKHENAWVTKSRKY